MRPPLVLFVVVAGCRFESDLGGTHYLCAEGVACPGGQVCVAGQCQDEAPAGDGATTPDGGGDGTGDGGPPPPTCGQAARLFADDFHLGVLDRPWTYNGSPPSIVDQQLSIPTEADSAATFSTVRTTLCFDLRGSRMSVKAVQLPDPATGAEARFEARWGPADALGIVAQAGVLHFFHVSRVSGYGEDGTTPYVAADHRFWQIREEAGMVRFETSPDGAAWTERAATPTPELASFVAFTLSAGTAAAEATAPGPAIFDDANGGTIADPGAWCAAVTLADDFEDPVQDYLWQNEYYFGGACTVQEDGGTLHLVLANAGIATMCGVRSAAAYDLTAGAFTVRVTEAPGANTSASMRVADGQSLSTVDIAVGGGTIRFDDDPIPYDPAEHAYWRVAEAGGSIILATSGDGTTFTTQKTIPSPIDATRVQLYLRLQALDYGITASVRYDDVDLLP